ncbi:MAG: amidohydrolase [Desulfobacterales bacterium]|nr:MAG: amidohydrolase [Desulfobacterales bacterium]
MIIDFHTHIFPKTMREDRVKYFAGEPAFEYLYRSLKSKIVGAKTIIDSMDEQGVDTSVVFGFPWKNSILSQQHNDYIMEAVAKYSGRLVGLCCFDPSYKNAVEEVNRCIDGGLSGVGELAFYQSALDEVALNQLAPIMEICQRMDLPVLIHTNEPVGHIYPGKAPNTLLQIYDLIKRFQGNRIVLAHWGGGIFFFHLLKREVKDVLQNIYIDTAASPFLYDPEIYRYAVDILGSDKILFGSDFPLLNPSKYFEEMGQAGLLIDQIESICGRNAAKLLKL